MLAEQFAQQQALLAPQRWHSKPCSVLFVSSYMISVMVNNIGEVLHSLPTTFLAAEHDSMSHNLSEDRNYLN